MTHQIDSPLSSSDIVVIGIVITTIRIWLTLGANRAWSRQRHINQCSAPLTGGPTDPSRLTEGTPRLSSPGSWPTFSGKVNRLVSTNAPSLLTRPSRPTSTSYTAKTFPRMMFEIVKFQAFQTSQRHNLLQIILPEPGLANFASQFPNIYNCRKPTMRKRNTCVVWLLSVWNFSHISQMYWENHILFPSRIVFYYIERIQLDFSSIVGSKNFPLHEKKTEVILRSFRLKLLKELMWSNFITDPFTVFQMSIFTY